MKRLNFLFTGKPKRNNLPQLSLSELENLKNELIERPSTRRTADELQAVKREIERRLSPDQPHQDDETTGESSQQESKLLIIYLILTKV